MKVEKNEYISLGKKRLNAVFFAVILILSVVLVNLISGNIGAVDIYEPDDTPAQASVIPTDGSSQSHDFDPAGDEDWINFTVIPGTVYTIETLNLSPSVDTYIYLYESDGITIIDSDDDGGDGLASRIIWDSTGYPANYCYVRVIELGGDGGPGSTGSVGSAGRGAVASFQNGTGVPQPI